MSGRMHFMTRTSYSDGEVVDLYATEGGSTADGVQRVVVQPGLMERLRRQSHNSAVSQHSSAVYPTCECPRLAGADHPPVRGG